MSDPATREYVIEILEAMLDGQLRALRALRRGAGRRKPAGSRPGRKSNTDLVEDILLSAGSPLHVNEIISRALRDHGRELKRESIVSALTKKVLDGRTFRRTGRNRFGLLETAEDRP